MSAGYLLINYHAQWNSLFCYKKVPVEEKQYVKDTISNKARFNMLLPIDPARKRVAAYGVLFINTS